MAVSSRTVILRPIVCLRVPIFGLYIASANQELLVFLVPGDTTDLLGGINPLGSALSLISETTNSAFATTTNAASFRTSTGSLTWSGKDGFFGSITANSLSDNRRARPLGYQTSKRASEVDVCYRSHRHRAGESQPARRGSGVSERILARAATPIDPFIRRGTPRGTASAIRKYKVRREPDRDGETPLHLAHLL